MEVWKLADGLKKTAEIRGKDRMIIRGEGTQNNKGSLCGMDIKEIMIIYLHGVSDIGRKILLQIW